MYYESHGAGGTPLVLVHGGGSTIGTNFGRILPLLARSRRVIAVEVQAHGHTLDIDRPFTFAQDADDVAALLDSLGVSKAHVLGFSNGGGPRANTPGQTQRLDSVIGAILRIDPRSPSVSGGTKGLGDDTIPPTNKFAADGDPKTLGEIYAYGFRNAHRLSGDLTEGTMFASDMASNQTGRWRWSPVPGNLAAY
jgi:hypothetical protein